MGMGIVAEFKTDSDSQESSDSDDAVFSINAVDTELKGIFMCRQHHNLWRAKNMKT